MIIGVASEIKLDEQRVALLPVGVRALVESGHSVYIKQGASTGAGVPDEDYLEAGAMLVDTAAEVFEKAEMVVKVKEPQSEEITMIREDQVVFTFFHFAANVELTRSFMETGAVALAYETVEDASGALPLLIPMSEIAGRMAVPGRGQVPRGSPGRARCAAGRFAGRGPGRRGHHRLHIPRQQCWWDCQRGAHARPVDASALSAKLTVTLSV